MTEFTRGNFRLNPSLRSVLPNQLPSFRTEFTCGTRTLKKLKSKCEIGHEKSTEIHANLCVQN